MKLFKYDAGQLQKPNSALSLTNKILEIDSRKLFIIHLDDHRIFRRGVKHCLLKNLPNILIKEFTDNEKALFFIDKCFKQKEKIDLIITDYNHPGPNGLIFAQRVRELEQVYKVKTPLMLLTMRWENEILTKATENGIFDIYFPKSIEPEQIVNFVKNNTNK